MSLAEPPAPRPFLGLLPALGATLAVRLLAFPLTHNFYGDAAARVFMAEAWARSPHWISGFADGAWQFGPLHLYVLGAASMLGASHQDGGRLASLLFGVATVVPLWLLCRRLNGLRAANASCLVFAFWGLHIQFSTTAASEALALFLVVACLAAFAAERPMSAGAMLSLACATRYETWLLIPILGAALLVRRRYVDAARFGALALVFPAVWMVGNARLHGDPLYPTTYINEFHRSWFAQSEAYWGIWKHRLLNLFFWPLCAAVTLTPMVTIAGALRARRDWLTAVMVVPMTLLTVRSTLIGDFEPLARFTALSLVVLVVAAGPRIRWPHVAALLALTLALGAYTWEREGGWADSLKSVSPVTTLPRAVLEAAERARACPGVPRFLADDRYRDLSAAFYAGVPVTLERNGAGPGACEIHF